MPERILCESPKCPHTARWLTDSGRLYCEGHKYLDPVGHPATAAP